MNFKNFAIVSLVAAAAAGQATVYNFNWPGATGGTYGINHAAGEIKSMSASYNTQNKSFNYYLTMGKVPGSNTLKTNGFWLVVSPGANPKGHAGELAILYFDASTSNTKLTAYTYNGQNGFTSFQNQDKIASSSKTANFVKSMVVSDTPAGRVLGFSIDATKIQNHVPSRPGPGGAADWTGVSFGEKMGVWMHPVAGLRTGYGNDGFLCNFDFNKAGWFDGEGFRTQSVPEPTTMAALAIGSLIAARRRRSK